MTHERPVLSPISQDHGSQTYQAAFSQLPANVSPKSDSSEVGLQGYRRYSTVEAEFRTIDCAIPAPCGRQHRKRRIFAVPMGLVCISLAFVAAMWVHIHMTASVVTFTDTYTVVRCQSWLIPGFISSLTAQRTVSRKLSNRGQGQVP